MPRLLARKDGRAKARGDWQTRDITDVAQVQSAGYHASRRRWAQLQPSCRLCVGGECERTHRVCAWDLCGWIPFWLRRHARRRPALARRARALHAAGKIGAQAGKRFTVDERGR